MWICARSADTTQVVPQRRNIHTEVGRWQGKTIAADDGNEGVGGLHKSDEAGERNGKRTRPSKGGPC